MRNASGIQQDSRTLPSLLEVHRLAATASALRLASMYTSRQVALLIGFALLALPIWAADDCRSQRERRNQLARQAMQAEITKLQAIRQRLCPQLEALASQASALSTTGRSPIDLDYGAYIDCRTRAEIQLERSHPVLYRNRLGFTFYTPSGAALARQADALQARLDLLCNPPRS